MIKTLKHYIYTKKTQTSLPLSKLDYHRLILKCQIERGMQELMDWIYGFRGRMSSDKVGFWELEKMEK